MAGLVRSALFGSVSAGPLGDVGLLVLRVVAGLALALAHGINKLPPPERFVQRIEGFGFPAPELFGWLSGIAETGGGLLLALGLFTRPAAALIVINLAVALVFAHAGDPFAARELALLFGSIALAYVFMGAGRYALDSLARGSARGAVAGSGGRKR